MAGDRARLAVIDTGKGISGNFLAHVFERFRQADASSTRAEAGLGLGLAIVRHIVELHRGRVRADSAGEGAGATFTVDLPIAAPAEDGPVDAVGLGDITAETIDLDGVSVLIVDDHVDSRDLVTTVLSRRGAEVTAVDSVREGLAAARRVRPDVIVCDLAMPGDDGFALIREIRSRPGDQGSVIPAVALPLTRGPRTANGRSRRASRCTCRSRSSREPSSKLSLGWPPAAHGTATACAETRRGLTIPGRPCCGPTR